METFSALLAQYIYTYIYIYEEKHRIPLTKARWCGALMLSLMCAWINGWINSGNAGDLKCNDVHVTSLQWGNPMKDACDFAVPCTVASLLWVLNRALWSTGFMVFLCVVFTVLFNVHFGKFVMTFIDIGEIGCMSIPKCHWMVIVVNLVKQTWFFAWCCLLVRFRVCQVSIGCSRL